MFQCFWCGKVVPPDQVQRRTVHSATVAGKYSVATPENLCAACAQQYDDAARNEAAGKRKARMIAGVIVACLVGAAVVALLFVPKKGPEETAEQAEIKRLQGKWEGTCEFADDTRTTTWEFSGDRVTIRVLNTSSGLQGTATFRLDRADDPASNTKRINFDGDQQGRLGGVLGIYQLSGDDLKVQYRRSSHYPDGFEWNCEGCHLAVLHRVSK